MRRAPESPLRGGPALRPASRVPQGGVDGGAGGGARADEPAGGHGIVGMRERAAMFGGTLEAGPLPGGGFQVRAVLPVPGLTPGQVA